jgi:hypothetical protein
MRVLIVLIFAGFGWGLIGFEKARAKFSPNSLAASNHKVERAWNSQQRSIRTHGFGSPEYLRRQEIYLAAKAERDAEFGEQN